MAKKWPQVAPAVSAERARIISDLIEQDLLQEHLRMILEIIAAKLQGVRVIIEKTLKAGRDEKKEIQPLHSKSIYDIGLKRRTLTILYLRMGIKNVGELLNTDGEELEGQLGCGIHTLVDIYNTLRNLGLEMKFREDGRTKAEIEAMSKVFR